MAAEEKSREGTAKKARGTAPELGKDQILASERYHSQRDLVDALLEEEDRYTTEAVDRLIERYKKGQVR